MSAFEKITSDRLLQDHWLRRLIAAIIDSVITWVATWIIIALVTLPFWFFGALPFFFGPAELLHGVIFFLYAAFLESSQGATLGKMIMNLKVTTTQGQMPSFDKALIRNVSKIYGLLWLLDTILGMATAGDPRQKYSDRYAGTTVESRTPGGYILPTPQSTPPPPPPSG